VVDEQVLRVLDDLCGKVLEPRPNDVLGEPLAHRAAHLRQLRHVPDDARVIGPAA
jgi:hypothetical protein